MTRLLRSLWHAWLLVCLGWLAVCPLSVAVAYSSTASTLSTYYSTATATATPTASFAHSVHYKANYNWREPSSLSTATYCMPVPVRSGLFIYTTSSTRFHITLATPPPINTASPSNSNTTTIYARAATFVPLCPDGQTIIVNGKRNLVRTNLVEYSLGYSVSTADSPFYNSVIPTCVVLAATLALHSVTLLVMLSQFHKRPKYQLLTVCITAASIVVIFVRVSAFLQNQARHGYYDGNELSDYLETDSAICLLQPINGFFLTMAQIQVLLPIFVRRKERAVVFWIGLVLSLTRFALSVVSAVYGKFQNDGSELGESKDAVTVVAYLFQIAMSIMYAACLVYFGIVNYTIAYRPEVLLLACISHLAAVAPVVLFLLDILESYIDAWSDFADISALMASSIVAWEWIDRVTAMERSIQARSVLGRPYYDENEKPAFQRHSRESPTLVATPTDSSSTDQPQPAKPPPQLQSPHKPAWQTAWEWIKHPVQRPDTSSSAHTMYVSVTPRPSQSGPPARPPTADKPPLPVFYHGLKP